MLSSADDSAPLASIPNGWPLATGAQAAPADKTAHPAEAVIADTPVGAPACQMLPAPASGMTQEPVDQPPAILQGKEKKRKDSDLATESGTAT